MTAHTHSLADLPAFTTEEGEEACHVVIETPKGSRNKFTYDEDLHLFKLGGVLPTGHSFPYDFGFIPSTLGGDGDPLDVLVLMDESAFPGCLIHTRLIGVIEAEQTEDGKTERNDRIIAVAIHSRNHADVSKLGDLHGNIVDEIEHFFVSYNESKGKHFNPLGRGDGKRAREIIEAGIKQRRK